MDGLEEAYLHVKFFTKQERYSVPDIPLSIPSCSGTVELNRILNQLLDADSSAVQFDFLIDGEFVQLSLEEHVNERNLPKEGTIEIEYVESASPPTPSDSILHDDWVTAVKASKNLILTGSYDNVVRVWTLDGQLVHAVDGHRAAVKSVAWIKNEDGDQKKTFVSGSDDGTAMVWQWSQKAKFVQCSTVCSVPESSQKSLLRKVNSVAVNPSKNLFATGSQNCIVCIWSTEPAADEDSTSEKPRKKRKTDRPVVTTSDPLQTLEGHLQGVTSVVWLDDGTLCSASMDHTIHLWDVQKEITQYSITAPKPVFDVAHSPVNQMLVTSSADRFVRLYDRRTSGGNAVKSTFTSHSLWVSCVDWSRDNEYHFVSGSHDKLFKLWDTRSPKAPLYNMIGHEDKILCCDWSVPEYMISGGADKNIRIFRNSGNFSRSDEQ